MLWSVQVHEVGGDSPIAHVRHHGPRPSAQAQPSKEGAKVFESVKEGVWKYAEPEHTNALGIIFPNSYDNAVPELVTERNGFGPFAGRYRMVDFVLSSMANCGISNVSIVVRKTPLPDGSSGHRP